MQFNIIMGEVLAKPIEADYTDPALIKGSAYDTAIMLWVLPVLVAAGGHTYFQQHLSHAHSVVPFVVHSTFQKHGNIAKMNRFREEGIWAESDRSYYDRGWFMTFEMDVKRYIAEEAKRWKIQHGVVMQDHHKHMLAARYQL